MIEGENKGPSALESKPVLNKIPAIEKPPVET